jgi:DNA polymerase-3 subunit delta
MKYDSIEHWERRIDQGEIPPLLYLYGEDNDRALSFAERVVRLCLGPAIREFNYCLLDARETTMGRVIEIARTLPMMSNYRVVLVRNSTLFVETDWIRALPYLQAPCPSSCLIFRGEKPSCPKEVMKALEAHGAILEFRSRTEAQAERWLIEWTKREDKRILPDAVRALIERVGTREGDLRGEVEKLLIYIGEGDTIKEEDVQALSVEARTHRVFDLTDALIEKRTVDALRILHRLLEDGSSPLGLVGMMARQVRLIWFARQHTLDGKRIAEWPTRLSVPPFLRKRLLIQASQWTEDELAMAVEGLVKVDKSLKRGRLDPEILLDQWVLNLGNRARPQQTPRPKGPEKDL